MRWLITSRPSGGKCFRFGVKLWSIDRFTKNIQVVMQWYAMATTSGHVLPWTLQRVVISLLLTEEKILKVFTKNVFCKKCILTKCLLSEMYPVHMDRKAMLLWRIMPKTNVIAFLILGMIKWAHRILKSRSTEWELFWVVVVQWFHCLYTFCFVLSFVCLFWNVEPTNR